ncbi:MAG TPA: hypothetical protein VMH39_05215, partial [Gemmatimonadaceae bacterium]|nr:hypothetical protein [Gemmatimonadaceae bacterium]
DEVLAALRAIRLEANPPASVPRGPRLISDTEAHAVWQRAAELQAATGVHPRPEPVARARDDLHDRARTSGFRLDEVRSAASEAGIDDRYVAHALAEHGLAPAASRVQSEPIVVSPPESRSFWAGAPLDIVVGAEVAGEVGPGDFDRLMHVLRDGTARLGTTLAESRELRWRCAWLGHRLDVAVVPDRGRTRIRLSQSVRRMAVGTVAASMALIGGVAAPLTGIVLYELMRVPARPLFRVRVALANRSIREIAATVAAVVAVSSIPIGWAAVRWMRRQNAARLRTLGEALAARCRELLRGG